MDKASVRPSHVTRWWGTPRTSKKAQFMALISHERRREAHQGEERPFPPRTIHPHNIAAAGFGPVVCINGGSECYFIPKFPIEECVAEIRGLLFLRLQLSYPPHPVLASSSYSSSSSSSSESAGKWSLILVLLLWWNSFHTYESHVEGFHAIIRRVGVYYRRENHFPDDPVVW